MAVDMFPRRFKEELNKLPLFVPATTSRIGAEHIPAWRSVFTSLLYYGHARGYRLFSFAQFWKAIEKAFNRGKFAELFAMPTRAALEQRARAWYESGMNETYLYACLVEVIEDKAKCGVVLYDARADWKLKADTVVIIKGMPIRIDVFRGSTSARPNTIARRDSSEREAKINTMESSHYDNEELKRWKTIQVALDPSASININGVRLFNDSTINVALREIYDYANVTEAQRAFL